MSSREPTAPKLDDWGQPGNLTPSQQEALATFRAQVKESDLDIVKFKIESYENASLRYLRARSFNIPNAIQLMNDCIKRKTEDRYDYYAKLTPDQCAECSVDALCKFYPHGQVGYDVFNRPILFEHSGAVDGHAIHQMTTTANLIHYHWWSMETNLNEMFEKAPRKEGEPPIISTCVILDLSGLSMHHCTGIVLEHVKAMVALDNVCYPEILGKMLVVNAPWLAVQMWEMVKSWLDPRTQQKIEIMRPDGTTKQSDRLLQFISPEHLPVRYGGTRAEFMVTRRNTEYVSVGRSSVIRKFMFVPVGHRIIIDSYLTDGELICDVYSRRVKFPTFAESSKSYLEEHESIGNSEHNKFIQGTSNLSLLTHQEMKGPGDKKPRRFLLEFEANECDLHVVVSWSNLARMVTRPLVYSLCVLGSGDLLDPYQHRLNHQPAAASESASSATASAAAAAVDASSETATTTGAATSSEGVTGEEQVVLEEMD